MNYTATLQMHLFLVGVKPQERILRHTVEQIGDISPVVHTLRVLEPQMVDAVLKRFDTLLPVPEQIIAMPKISSPSRPLRAAIAATQMAEQLVKVPADVVAVLLRAEQTVDIPVPGHGSSGYGDLRGFPPGQSPKAPFVEQHVPVGVPQDFLPDQGSAASCSVPADEPFQGFFSHFSQAEKVRTLACRWVARQLIHAERSSNGSCRSRCALKPNQPRRRLLGR